MKRFSISLDEKLASEFDRLIRERGYKNRYGAAHDMDMCAVTSRTEPI
jgi:CopG family nickel-responsive transcriptional regulator